MGSQACGVGQGTARHEERQPQMLGNLAEAGGQGSQMTITSLAKNHRKNGLTLILTNKGQMKASPSCQRGIRGSQVERKYSQELSTPRS